MWRRVLRYTGASLLLLVLGAVAYEYAAAYHPPAERTAMLERGRAIYRSICQECHGGQMEGRMIAERNLVVPPLNKPGFRTFFFLMPADMEGFVTGLIGTGRGGMPSFQATLSTEDRRALALLIHAVNVGDAKP
jgi:mono/diheme cytochrome c family protein